MKTILKGEASKTLLLYFMGGFHYRQTSETMGAPETKGSKLLIRFKMSLLWPFVSPLFCFRESNNQLGFPESCWDSKFSQKSASSTSAPSSLIFRRRRRRQGLIGWLCQVFPRNYDISVKIMAFRRYAFQSTPRKTLYTNQELQWCIYNLRFSAELVGFEKKNSCIE